MSKAAPLRFLGVLLGGWICIRAVLLSLGPTPLAALETPVAAEAALAPPAPAVAIVAAPEGSRDPEATPTLYAQLREQGPAPPIAVMAGAGETVFAAMSLDSVMPAEPPRAAGIGPTATIPTSLPARPSRWSGSAWLLARDDLGQPSLAPGGTLGGSQAGGRLMYRLDRHWSLSARAYLPLRRPAGAEIAAGVDWRPFASIPVSLLAERRQAIGSEGRSAFSITAYGGFSRAIGERFRIDGYAQAGMVGLRSRDGFVDGSLRAVATLGRFEVGGGAWGAAQPGASRLDIGPSLAYRLPVARTAVRIEADWRVRIAGDARPASGPALVLATDF
ncbi:MAG TPA: hypothetical protein VEW04_09790 [Allosphingosinicella sp.]|nr:hypothetical protein [Allosphingosinicella sp.]